MLTILFWILMLMIFGKILKFAIKATWGISKIIVFVILLPIVLIALVLQGLVALALPILVIIGVISLIVLHD